MTFRRVLTAVAVAASALALAPTATADQADTPQRVVTIESAARPGDVWDQSDWSGYPTIAYPAHGEANQRWEVGYNGTLKEQRDGLCATAQDDAVVGKPCDGSLAQQWRGEESEPWMIRNMDAGTCVTHDGSVRQLLLTTCDPERADQRWYVRD
ncbi:RICIN domain-containing protein [Saccharothrix stipae]